MRIFVFKRFNGVKELIAAPLITECERSPGSYKNLVIFNKKPFFEWDGSTRVFCSQSVLYIIAGELTVKLLKQTVFPPG